MAISNKDLFNQQSLEKALAWKYLQVFSNTKVQVFKGDLLEILKNTQQYTNLSLSCFNLWKVNCELNVFVQELQQQILIKNDEITLDNCNFSPFLIDAENLEYYQQRSLKEMNIKEDAIFLIEIRTRVNEPWFFKRKESHDKTGKKRGFSELLTEKPSLYQDKENVVFISLFYFKNNKF